MLTLAYYDRADAARRLRRYVPARPMPRAERLQAAQTELRGLGNVVICLVRGRYVRPLARRGL